jgi:palmitoyltransferase ZDHHC13/17
MSDLVFEKILTTSVEEFISFIATGPDNLCELFDPTGNSVIHFCVINSKEEVLRSILEYSKIYTKPVFNKWINHISNEGMSALLLAVSRGDLNAVKILVQYNANIYEKTSLGLGVIHLCAKNNHPEVLVYFHELRVSLAETDNKGGTPLHWAAYMGSFNVLSLLLSLKANKNIRDNEGRTPLHLAVIAGNEKIVRKLIIYGVSLDIKDKRGRIPLQIAIESRSKPLQTMLSPPTLVQELGCKAKTAKPYRTPRYIFFLFIFIISIFFLIIGFCDKKNSQTDNRVYTYIYMGNTLILIANIVYLISSNPGLVPLPKNVSLLELYKNPSNQICTECKILKPDRSRHCYFCTRCVYRYDHHCQWVNNCIGLRNNSVFFFFLFTMILFCFLSDFIAISVFFSIDDDGLIGLGTPIPIAVFVTVLSTGVLYPVTVLFLTQAKNFASNMTSSERLSKNKKSDSSTVFCLTNCVKMCKKA